MDIVLVNPDIPGNTGNVGRTCVATKTKLHLIEPIGFSLDDRLLKRAGLDYWKDLEIQVHPSFSKCMQEESMRGRPIFLFSRFAKKSLWETEFPRSGILVFGSETQGLPESIKDHDDAQLVGIPMTGPVRSLNLSTAVGIALYEALRQQK